MAVTVYVDLIFIVNFVIDGITLLATAHTRKLRLQWIRIIAASALGGLYVVMMFVPSLHLMFTFCVKVLFSLAMIAIAFKFGSLQNYLRNLGAFYMINFAAAGTIMGVHYFLQSSHEVMNGIFFTQSGGMQFQFAVGIVFVLLMIPVSIGWYRLIMRTAMEKDQFSSYLAEVEVETGHFHLHCKGLIDTGNQLYDPLTRTPVMIMEAHQWQEVLPASWLEALKEGQAEHILMASGNEQLAAIDHDWSARLRFVPYSGIHKGTQFMIAIKPDKVTIRQSDRSITVKKVLIGLKGEKLCADDAYQSIIHPSLVTGMATQTNNTL